MDLNELHAMLDTEPATARQVGAIHGEFRRLGFPASDRTGRLAACAALLGTGPLSTTAELTMGEAGRLVAMLHQLADRGQLAAAVAAAGDDPGDTAGGVSWARQLAKALAVVLGGFPAQD